MHVLDAKGRAGPPGKGRLAREPPREVCDAVRAVFALARAMLYDPRGSNLLCGVFI
jgi:hypothetical protein